MPNDTQYISKSLHHTPAGLAGMYLIQWEAPCQREQLQLTAVVHLKAEVVVEGAGVVVVRVGGSVLVIRQRVN